MTPPAAPLQPCVETTPHRPESFECYVGTAVWNGSPLVSLAGSSMTVSLTRFTHRRTPFGSVKGEIALCVGRDR